MMAKGIFVPKTITNLHVLAPLSLPAILEPFRTRICSLRAESPAASSSQDQDNCKPHGFRPQSAIGNLEKIQLVHEVAEFAGITPQPMKICQVSV